MFFGQNETIPAGKSFITTWLLCVIWSFYGQAQIDPIERVATLTSGKRSIESCLIELASQGIELSYSDNILPLRKTVEIKITKRSVYQHFLTLFDDEKVGFESRGNLILLYRSKKKLSKKIVLSGYVWDAISGESLIDAHVWVDSLNRGTTTNEYGFYSLSIRHGTHKISSSYLGVNKTTEPLLFRENTRLNFNLEIPVSELNEVIVSSRDQDVDLKQTPTGYHKIDLNTFSQVPYFLGEVDILQGALMLPGIKNLGEDAIGLNIRGGSTDQNLILLDEAPIYNSSHLFGLISVFNPDAVQQVEIHKSGLPAKHGGRASSVINVRKKDGNDKEYHMTGGIGLASTRLMVEGPLKMERSSFLLSARSSFTNFSFFNFGDDISFNDTRASFHDLNAKLNFKINKKNKVYLSGYFGNDRNRIGEDQLRRWGNNTVTFRWNRQITPKLFMNTTAYFSEYSYRTGQPNKGIGEFIGTASNTDYAVKSDFSYFQSPGNSFDFGAGLIFHRIHPGDREPNIGNETFNAIQLDSKHAIEPYVYFANQQQISDRINLNYGIRFSQLNNIGPGEVFIYEENEVRETENIIDTINYKNNELIKSYKGVEPRISINYTVGQNSSFKLSFDRTVQYMHLISNTASPSPTDVWQLSDTYIKPQEANQLTFGYQQFLGEHFELTAEVFGRKMYEIIDYKNGADLLLNNSIETELLSGDGRAFGFEFLIKKNHDKLSGWISYNLSKSERRIRGITPELSVNEGRYFPADFDRLHDFTMVGIYNINNRWSLSSSFVFRTGRPITLPNAKYEFENSVVPNFSERNNGRIANYHRLDISAVFKGKKASKRKREQKVEDYWTFSVYNVYSRRNAFSYFFRQSEEVPFQTEIVKYSILGSIVPAITYNFRF
ncbi:MAG: carboxypeptidase-like regulatory domain-containing protein [Cyclobacteriaceae bacterium]